MHVSVQITFICLDFNGDTFSLYALNMYYKCKKISSKERYFKLLMWIFKSLFSYWILLCSINLKYFLEVPEKRNEIYILNPKKAYNICELYFVFALSDLVVILLNVCMCWKVFLYVLYPFFNSHLAGAPTFVCGWHETGSVWNGRRNPHPWTSQTIGGVRSK